jgi:hypothetical protein
MLLMAQFLLVIFSELLLPLAYFFPMLLIILLLLFSMRIIIGFTSNTCALSTDWIKPVWFRLVTVKEFAISRKDFFTFSALFHTFKGFLFGVVNLPVCAIALFASIIQSIWVALIPNKKIRCGILVLFTCKTLLNLCGGLMFSGNVVEQFNRLAAECLKIERALIVIVCYTSLHDKISKSCHHASGYVQYRVGKTLLPLVLYHNPASEASLHHFCTPQYLQTSALGGAI